jgi:Rap1a immunity proteins
MRFAPFLLALLLAPQFTHNRFTEGGKTFSQDGVNLTTACMSKVGDGAIMAEMLCGGYVEGIADLLSEDAICVPPEAAGKQLVDVVMQYAEKHQEMLHHPASRIVSEALKAKYRCVQ